jgi:arylsulfatase A-like enzyme
VAPLVLMAYVSALPLRAPALAATERAAAPATRPNIVLILTDDQRWDSLAQLPATNARSWRRYTESFTVEPMCCPSRASTLSGQTPVHTRVDTLHKGELFDEQRTFATMLHAAGYRTVFAGKYLNKWPYGRGAYIPPGWDRFYAFGGGDKYYRYRLIENGKPKSYGAKPAHYSTDVLARKVVREIEQAPKNKPLLVEYAPYGPHRSGEALNPIPAPRHVGVCDATSFPFPSNFNVGDEVSEPAWLAGEAAQSPAIIARSRRKTCETLRSVDEAITSVIDALVRTRRLANTYVIVTSDNGYHFGEHRLISKGDLYEESVRVPLLVRGPGVVPGTDARLTSNIDLAPTFLEWARVSPPRVKPFDGSSFAASARGMNVAGPTAVLLRGCRTSGAATVGGGACGAHPTNMGMNWGLRTTQYKYVVYPDGYQQLFDLTVDPGEVHNLAPDPFYAATVAALDQQLLVLRGDAVP